MSVGTGECKQPQWLRAAVGHAVSFWTWRSLCLDQGLTDTEAVALMTGMVLAITPMSAEPAR